MKVTRSDHQDQQVADLCRDLGAITITKEEVAKANSSTEDSAKINSWNVGEDRKRCEEMQRKYFGTTGATTGANAGNGRNHSTSHGTTIGTRSKTRLAAEPDILSKNVPTPESG